jgi:aspartate/methionine/tyrosine aminotransferase
MRMPGPIEPFSYMGWAKTYGARARFPLNLSSVVPREWPEVFPDGAPQAPLLAGAGPYGRENLKDALGARWGISGGRIAIVPGTSGGNYLVLASLLRPGDRVLVESPTYTVFDKIARQHGAEVDWLRRLPERGFAIDPEEVARAWRDGTRLLVLTNPNNPTGVTLDRETRDRLLALVAERDAYLLLDEVYHDFVVDTERYPPGEPSAGGDPATRLVVTGSLTKVYGLGELRLGWVVGAPEVVQGVLGYQDLVQVLVPNPIQAWGTAIIPRLGVLREEAQAIVARGWSVFEPWAARTPRVSYVPPQPGAQSGFVFLRLDGIGDTRGFCERLLEDRDTLVSPGEFFGLAGWVRIGLGIPPELLREGLARLTQSG